MSRLAVACFARPEPLFPRPALQTTNQGPRHRSPRRKQPEFKSEVFSLQRVSLFHEKIP